MTDARANARSTGWTWIAAIWCAGALFEASQILLTMHAVGAGKAWRSSRDRWSSRARTDSPTFLPGSRGIGGRRLDVRLQDRPDPHLRRVPPELIGCHLALSQTFQSHVTLASPYME